MKRQTFITIGVLATTAQILGCSWNDPVWSKNNKSDTALFRFVTGENRTGYIDRDGKVIIRPTLSSYGNYGGDDFFYGLAKVELHNKYWYIDPTGKPLFRASFSAGRFSEGFAVYRDGSKEGYIDRHGKVAILASYDSANDFSEGLAVVGMNRLAVVGMNRLYGYIRKDGGVAIEPMYVLAMSFANGFARLIEYGRCLYIGYGPCDAFNPETLPYDGPGSHYLSAPACLYGFIDKDGKRLFEKHYPGAKDSRKVSLPLVRDAYGDSSTRRER